MQVELKCPFCNASLGVDINQETDVSCPVCQQVFTVPVEMINQQIDDNLLDPSDPAGYLNNFPPEDDF